MRGRLCSFVILGTNPIRTWGHFCVCDSVNYKILSGRKSSLDNDSAVSFHPLSCVTSHNIVTVACHPLLAGFTIPPYFIIEVMATA